jgi:hypothetical protein
MGYFCRAANRPRIELVTAIKASIVTPLTEKPSRKGAQRYAGKDSTNIISLVTNALTRKLHRPAAARRVASYSR